MTDNSTMPIFNRSVPEGVDLYFVDFTNDKVRSVIKKLKANGSCSPDGHSPLLFKRTIDCVAEPLSLIFMSLMAVGRVSMGWSHAMVTPVYKNTTTTLNSRQGPHRKLNYYGNSKALN